MKWRVLLQQDSETGDWAAWCPELPEYVLGILNSRLVNWFYKRRFTNSSKLTVNLSKEYMGQIPMKTPDKAVQKPMERLVDRILAAKQRNAEADVSALEQEIDQLVYALYGLTPEEIQVVEGSAKSTPQR